MNAKEHKIREQELLAEIDKIKKEINNNLASAEAGLAPYQDMLPIFQTSKTTFLIPSAYDPVCNSFSPSKPKLLI